MRAKYISWIVLSVAVVMATAVATAQGQTAELPPLPSQQTGAAALAVDFTSPVVQQPQQPTASGDEKHWQIVSQKPKTDQDDPNDPNEVVGHQPKRILGIIPNFRAVSTYTYLPPLTVKQKFWLGTQDTVDYSNFIFVALLSGISFAQKSEPSFGQGASGYGQYYWHIYVDGAIENYLVESILPTVTKEDPRYYTKGRGGFFKRTGYAASRMFITRKDGSIKNTFNISEIVGAGAAAGLGNFCYPKESNP